jgi:ankyrin repeat protein
MKTLMYVNWGFFVLYLIYLIFAWISTNSSGMDAAGRGMAKGFAVIGFVAVIVLGLLNLIDLKIIRFIVLILFLVPILFALRNGFLMVKRNTINKKGFAHAQYFTDPHLKKIVVAADKFDLDEMNRLLDEDDSKINVLGKNQETLLGIVARNASYNFSENGLPMVKMLLDRGADPNINAPEKGTILAEVAMNSSFELFKLLLDSGADPNGKDEHGVALLYKLVKDEYRVDLQKLELLLRDYHADPNAVFGQEGWTLNFSALLFAASAHQWEACKMLIEYGANTDFKPPSEMDFWFYLKNAEEEYARQDSIPDSFTTLKAIVK